MDRLVDRYLVNRYFSGTLNIPGWFHLFKNTTADAFKHSLNTTPNIPKWPHPVIHRDEAILPYFFIFTKKYSATKAL